MKEETHIDWRAAVKAAFAAASRIVVCGIGNDLRGDDAAGILCVRGLKAGLSRIRSSAEGRRTTVFLIEGGETPENQTGPIRGFGPDLVVLIDAACSGGMSGDIFVVDPKSIADDEVSTHRISLGMLVRYIRESIGPDVLFLGIEPETTEMGRGASKPVQEAVLELTDVLLMACRDFFERNAEEKASS